MGPKELPRLVLNGDGHVKLKWEHFTRMGFTLPPKKMLQKHLFSSRTPNGPGNRDTHGQGATGGPGGALATNEPGADCFKQSGSNGSLGNPDLFSKVDRNFAVPRSSLKPILGKDRHILRQLKINLLDMETSSEWRSAWCAFVKSADTIHI